MKKLKCDCLGFVCGSKFFVVKPCDSEGVKVGLIKYDPSGLSDATEEEIKAVSTYIKNAVASFVTNKEDDESDYLNYEDDDNDVEDWWTEEDPVFIPQEIVKKCHKCGEYLSFHTIPEGEYKTTATCIYCGVEGEYRIEAGN